METTDGSVKTSVGQQKYDLNLGTHWKASKRLMKNLLFFTLSITHHDLLLTRLTVGWSGWICWIILWCSTIEEWLNDWWFVPHDVVRCLVVAWADWRLKYRIKSMLQQNNSDHVFVVFWIQTAIVRSGNFARNLKYCWWSQIEYIVPTLHPSSGSTQNSWPDSCCRLR